VNLRPPGPSLGGRLPLLIDAYDREIIAWRAVANAGISGADVRDILLEAVEKRFGTCRAPEVIEVLTDNGGAYTQRKPASLPVSSA